MKTLLLTGFDKKMEPIGELTSPLMLSYANKHGFDFKCFRQFPDGKPAYWEKIPQVVRALENGYDRVIWLDADQVITNPEFLPPWEKGFHASLDWGKDVKTLSDFSMCGFVACQDSIIHFRWLLANESSLIDKPFPEQAPMRELHAKGAENMFIHPRTTFNAVPVQVHKSVLEPWEPNHFCAHITMAPVEDRVRIFKEIQNDLTMHYHVDLVGGSA